MDTRLFSSWCCSLGLNVTTVKRWWQWKLNSPCVETGKNWVRNSPDGGKVTQGNMKFMKKVGEFLSAFAPDPSWRGKPFQIETNTKFCAREKNSAFIARPASYRFLVRVLLPFLTSNPGKRSLNWAVVFCRGDFWVRFSHALKRISYFFPLIFFGGGTKVMLISAYHPLRRRWKRKKSSHPFPEKSCRVSRNICICAVYTQCIFAKRCSTKITASKNRRRGKGDESLTGG